MSAETEADSAPGASAPVGRVRTVRWVPHGEPWPEGWMLCETAPSHHDAHALLFEQIEPAEETVTEHHNDVPDYTGAELAGREDREA